MKEALAMSAVRERFRRVLAGDGCTLAANIFDPLSARIAHMLEYPVCVLSGSVGKVANLGVPDIVLSNMSDVVDHCRRITRMADVSLMVDAEDGFGNAVNVARTVREMEGAGVSAIEIEDNLVPRRFNVSNPGLVSREEQVGKLQAAVAARTDPTTVIVARSAALGECPLEEALNRIAAYSATGAEAVMLGNPTFAVAVKAIYDSLKHLKDGGALEGLAERQAPPDLLRRVNRTDEFLQIQEEYLRS
jgi:oxaloacetate decarboxylase